MTIQSRRLSLIPFDIPILEALIGGDRSEAGRLLGCEIPVDLSLSRMPLVRRLRQLREDPLELPWLLRGIINRATGALIGHIGFHSSPRLADLSQVAADGVEMGYTITPACRRQGYAREAAVALMRWAFENHQQRCFVLSISPENVPSTAMAQSMGFTPCASHIDEEDGLEIIFVRRFENWPREW